MVSKFITRKVQIKNGTVNTQQAQECPQTKVRISHILLGIALYGLCVTSTWFHLAVDLASHFV